MLIASVVFLSSQASLHAQPYRPIPTQSWSAPGTNTCEVFGILTGSDVIESPTLGRQVQVRLIAESSHSPDGTLCPPVGRRWR